MDSEESAPALSPACDIGTMAALSHPWVHDGTNFCVGGNLQLALWLVQRSCPGPTERIAKFRVPSFQPSPEGTRRRNHQPDGGGSFPFCLQELNPIVSQSRSQFERREPLFRAPRIKLVQGPISRNTYFAGLLLRRRTSRLGRSPPCSLIVPA